MVLSNTPRPTDPSPLTDTCPARNLARNLARHPVASPRPAADARSGHAPTLALAQAASAAKRQPAPATHHILPPKPALPPATAARLRFAARLDRCSRLHSFGSHTGCPALGSQPPFGIGNRVTRAPQARKDRDQCGVGCLSGRVARRQTRKQSQHQRPNQFRRLQSSCRASLGCVRCLPLRQNSDSVNRSDQSPAFCRQIAWPNSRAAQRCTTGTSTGRPPNHAAISVTKL